MNPAESRLATPGLVHETVRLLSFHFGCPRRETGDMTSTLTPRSVYKDVLGGIIFLDHGAKMVPFFGSFFSVYRRDCTRFWSYDSICSISVNGATSGPDPKRSTAKGGFLAWVSGTRMVPLLIREFLLWIGLVITATLFVSKGTESAAAKGVFLLGIVTKRRVERW